ncbi:MAG: WecB/TagA/CpsF family glycosyltransferase [Chloroflexi bacterium]|nr:MAG: WecB/TagA/CpsF family glycosyltransferase [Chloroflexota bacterium]TMD52595.1 MAG: WecB/TagA/CpsF family glycosyltransferase [Chloroflexota bacterium]
MTSIRVLGVRVDAVDPDSALARIEELVAGGGHHLVATVNPEFIMRARSDPAFQAVLDSAGLCLPDGWGVIWAARRQGRPLPGRVPGVDLIPPLAARAARLGWRLFLLGAAPGVAEAAAERLRADYPGLVITGCHAGEAGPEGDEESLRRIAAAGADIVLVAYGAPRQELWIARNLARLPAAVGIGVGGAFDFLSGRVRRAPGWMRRLGLEWLFRLAVQPWRARRMAVLPRFALEVLRTRA